MKKKNDKIQKVRKHIKGDIKTWDREKEEDEELLRSLRKKNGKKKKKK